MFRTELWSRVWLGLGISCFCCGLAQGQPPSEYEHKVLFLEHFAHYTDWPKNGVPGDDKTFVIGVLGPDPFGAHLKKLTEVQKKKVVIKLFASINDYEPCHLLFISREKVGKEGAEERLASAQAKTEGKPVLILGDQEGLAEKGAVASLYLNEANKVRFEVNRASAKRAGLTLSANHILRHAKIIGDAKEK